MVREKAMAFVSLLLLTGALAAKAPEPPNPDKQKPQRTDRHGDPLPAGAVARIGTIRFRHNTNLYSLCYSPDGKTLASIGDEGVCLWDAATGKAMHRYDLQSAPDDDPFPQGGYHRGFFSPDGRRLWLQSVNAGHNPPKKEISVVSGELES